MMIFSELNLAANSTLLTWIEILKLMEVLFDGRLVFNLSVVFSD